MSDDIITALFTEDAGDFFCQKIHHNPNVNGSFGAMIFAAARRFAYGGRITMPALMLAIHETEAPFANSRVVRVLS